MAKGQKRSNRQARKPKQAKAKPVEPTRSFLEPVAKLGRSATASHAKT